MCNFKENYGAMEIKVNRAVKKSRVNTAIIEFVSQSGTDIIALQEYLRSKYNISFSEAALKHRLDLIIDKN